MWPFFPKKCNCSETPTNPGKTCNESKLVGGDVIYQGPDVECAGIYNGMLVSEVLQQMDYYLCSLEFTQQVLDVIQDNPQEFNDFITLVNGVINCETINACGLTPTTTTSTTNLTTTSTTTLPECLCVTITIDQDDLFDAIGNTSFPTSNNKVLLQPAYKGGTCEGEDIPGEFNVAGVYSICIKQPLIDSLELYYMKNNLPVYIINSQIVNSSLKCNIDDECSL